MEYEDMTPRRKINNLTRILSHSQGFTSIEEGESDLDGRKGIDQVHDA